MKRIVILISGRGSNMQALVHALRQPVTAAEVVAVISDVATAPGLAWAEQQALATACAPRRARAERAAFEAELSAAIDAHAPDLIVLAGFMRVLSPAFIERYPDRIINVHPSLLPAFEGLNTHRRALETGVLVHGCTVHGVDAELDRGPPLMQAVVPVLPDDDETRLSERVLAFEHRILPATVRAWASGDLSWQGRRVRRAPGVPRILLHPSLHSSLIDSSHP